MEDPGRKITETVPIFFFIYHLVKKEILFISPQFYDLAVNIDSNEENPLVKCIHPDYKKKLNNFLDDLSEKNNYEGTVELKANEKLKGIGWLELNTFPVKEKDQTDASQVVGHLIDTTLKKGMLKTLQEEKKHITNMLNMMVHDLRAPFNRIQMIAGLLEDNMTEEEQKKHSNLLTMLRKQGEDSVELIQSLLRLATLKGEVNSLDLNIHDLRELTEKSLNQHKIRIEEKELKLVCEFPDEAVKAKVDAVLFLQVLDNLLSNSIKFTPKGGKITCRLWYEKGNVRFEIRDTGIGIPEKSQGDLFRSFNSFRRKGLDGEQSVGLGLFICKEIITLHQGVIDLVSKEDEGTAFLLTLPFPESSAAYY